MICFNFYFDKQSVEDILREIVTTSKVALTNIYYYYYYHHTALCRLQVVRLDPFHAVSSTLALYTATVPDWDTVTLACPSLNKVREGDHHCVFCIQTFTGFCLFKSHLNALYQDQESTLYIYLPCD